MFRSQSCGPAVPSELVISLIAKGDTPFQAATTSDLPQHIVASKEAPWLELGLGGDIGAGRRNRVGWRPAQSKKSPMGCRGGRAGPASPQHRDLDWIELYIKFLFSSL